MAALETRSGLKKSSDETRADDARPGGQVRAGSSGPADPRPSPTRVAYPTFMAFGGAERHV
jgi:hypothetical protein